MEKNFKLFKAKKQNFDKLSGLIALSMMEDPINLYFFPERKDAVKKELQKVALFLLKFTNRYGEIWTNEKNTMVCLFLKPGYPSINILHLIRFNHLPTLANFNREDQKKTNHVQKVTKDIERAKKEKGAHWYIQTLCIDTPLQGKGWGTKLLKEILEHIKKEKEYPVLLETTNPANLIFYEKNNFHVMCSKNIREDLNQYLLEWTGIV